MKGIIFILILIIFFGCNKKPTENTTNSPPGKPVLIYPPEGKEEQDTNFTFQWDCSDPDGDPLKYDLYMYMLGDYDNQALIGSGITAKYYTCQGIKPNTFYIWRVIATDGKSETESDYSRFQTILTDELFYGHWEADAVSGTDELTFNLIMNADYTFLYTSINDTDGTTRATSTGHYTVVSKNTLRFEYDDVHKDDGYYGYTYYYNKNRDQLNIEHLSGFNFMNAKSDISWHYFKQKTHY